MTAMDAREVGRPSAKRGTRHPSRGDMGDSIGPGEGCLPWLGMWMRRLFWLAIVALIVFAVLVSL